MMIRCIIVEDEPPARKVLVKYINDIPFLELAGEFPNAIEAMEHLSEEEADLMFLDINLPKISGLNFLRSIKDPPEVIITTAYSEYALEGFELDVVDYLLKPISFERFLGAVSKLQKNPNQSPGSDQSNRPEQATNRVDQESHRDETETDSNSNSDATSPTDLPFTFVKSDNTMYRIDFKDIHYIESDEDYVVIITSDDRYKLRQTLKYWDAKLPDEQFVRVHKSFIVNISKIEHISGNRIIMNETSLPIGRSYKQHFLEVIEELM